MQVLKEQLTGIKSNQKKKIIERQNKYLDYLIDPNFQGENIIFVLWFENNTDTTRRTWNFLPKYK